MDPVPEIPVINFKPFLHGSSQDQAKVARQVDEAFSKHGFLYLANHGIPQEMADEAFQWTKKFYELSLNERLNLVAADKSKSHGYTALMTEIVRGTPSVKESFGFGNPNDSGRASVWPVEDTIPGFQEFFSKFYQDCATLTQHILKCLSMALHLSPTHSFEAYHTRSLFTMDLIHYPSIDCRALRSGSQVRLPAHSDLGVVTLLFQEDGPEDGVVSPGGLEIAVAGSSELGTSASYDDTGTWIPVAPRRGTVVVNVGYLLKRWTNARWRSAVHRVCGPPKLAGKTGPNESGERAVDEDVTIIPERFSIPFFSLPDAETVVEALPGTWSPERPKKWEPLEVQEYLKKKRREINLLDSADQNK